MRAIWHVILTLPIERMNKSYVFSFPPNWALPNPEKRAQKEHKKPAGASPPIGPLRKGRDEGAAAPGLEHLTPLHLLHGAAEDVVEARLRAAAHVWDPN